ncbi:MAG: DUF4249 domain-containing protein [Bacteroidales bacterium]|nr:DUF4249 domain-containing protein [Bacteroidales bacterium]MDZ4204014.1 DUF4249 domain-containing protein [Bacteroidales bacterium]
MNTKHILSLFLSIVLMVFSACVETVYDVDLPKTDPKLVVYSYISPDDNLMVRVTTSRPITERQVYGDPRWVKNATVKIKETGGQLATLTYDQEANYYFSNLSNLPIRAGRQYEIDVSTPLGLRATAICKVPPQNTTVRITKVDSSFQSYEMRYKVRIEFDDLPGEPYFYRIFASAVVEGNDPNNPQGNIFEMDLMFDYGQALIDSRIREGGNFVLEGTLYIYGGVPYNQGRLRGFRVKLLSVDEPYFRFHRSNNLYDGENPFAEPVIIYSNIANGLGVFAAYNLHEIYYPASNYLTTKSTTIGK